MYKVPEQYRITPDKADKMKNNFRVADKVVNSWLFMNAQVGDAETGMFILPNPRTMKGMFILCKASGGEGWEHVSISIHSEQRCPTWEEMCFVKSQFWGPEDCVVQFHPPVKEYVNIHDFCLHLWRLKETNIQTPPSILV